MFGKLINILKENPKKIVFTEGSDPRILNALSSAAFAISSLFPTKIGERKVLAKRRDAASKIRGSEPSVKTILVPFPLIFSINLLIIKKPHFPNHSLLYTEYLHKKSGFSQMIFFTSKNH